MKKVITMSEELMHRIEMYKESNEYESAKSDLADLFTWAVGAREILVKNKSKGLDYWTLLINRLADLSEIFDLFHQEANRE